MLIRNATLPDGSGHDIEIEGGRLAAFLPPSDGEAAGLVLPPLVDGHIHLDKTLLGLPWIANQAEGNGVADRIEAERKVRAGRTVPETETGANLVRQVIASGTLHMRCHVDIDNQLRLRNLQAILEVRERFRDLVPSRSWPSAKRHRTLPGTAKLLEEAIAQGADLVGGLDPVGIDGDLDAISARFRHREPARCRHRHPPTRRRRRPAEIVAIAQRSCLRPQGQGRVSHAWLDRPSTSRVRPTCWRAAAIMSHGRARTMPPVKLLKDHGVEVFSGSDNIRDAWSPFGNGDMLERAMLVGYRANFRHDDELLLAFEMVTAAPARVLGLKGYGLKIGGPADLVVVDAGSVPEAVATRPRRKLVMKAGRVVARDGALV